jgi:uncharacterized protein (DUF427 family)
MEEPMAKAIWNGRIVAESNRTEIVEGNHYFPPQSIRNEFFRPSATQTTCPWKGEASYYSLEVDGTVNEDAAWFYPQPKEAARQIRNHVAFWRGVQVEP